MAGAVQESERKGIRFSSEEELREYEKSLYRFLVSEAGIHKGMLEAHGINYRVLHYFLGRGPVWSPRKEEVIRKVIEIVKEEYPGLTEVIEELENYYLALKEFAKKR